jgi:hypothetical protein
VCGWVPPAAVLVCRYRREAQKHGSWAGKAHPAAKLQGKLAQDGRLSNLIRKDDSPLSPAS